MIEKIPGTKNGYSFTKTSTNEQLAAVFSERPNIKCILVNTGGYKHFGIPLLGRNIFTINNKVGDMEFYINTFR